MTNLKYANEPAIITPIAVIMEEIVPDTATHAGTVGDAIETATNIQQM